MANLQTLRGLVRPAGALITALALALPVAAQETAPPPPGGNDGGPDLAIEEIVVHARLREERLQDVPASVTVFQTETLQRAGVQRPEDFIGLTPGVSLVDAAEAGDTQVNIRGINGSRDAENSFAFISDGILLSNPSAFNRDLLDLAQIEILKGPQGALYGRNAAAGAIIITTKRPTNEWETTLRASTGNHNSQYAAASLSGPLVRDSLYFRLSADWRSTDGFFHNSFLDRDNVDDFENYNLNARLLWEPSERLHVDAKLRYGEVDAAAITFNAVFAVPGLTGVNPKFFEDVNDHQFVFQSNIDPQNDQEALEFSLKFDMELGWAEWTGWLLYSDIEQNFLADGTSASFSLFATEPTCISSTASLNAGGVTLPAPQFLGAMPTFPPSVFGPYSPTTCDGYQYQVRNQEDLSFETRLASPADQSLRWLVGFYFLDLDREVGVSTGVDRDMGIDLSLFNPQGGRSPTEQLVHDEFETQVWAAFGQLSYDLGENIEASLALRYDREERKVSNLVPVNAQTLYIQPINPALRFRSMIPDQEETFDELQPKLSLTWDLSDETTLFASWGIGFKSGGFNNQGSAATVAQFRPMGANVQVLDRFEAETSSAIEVGFKSSFFNRRLSMEAALYQTSVDDMQFFEFFVGSFGLLRVVSNIDEVSIQGAELALRAHFTESFTAYTSFNITDSEIDRNASRPGTEGNESPYTPDYTLNLGFEYATGIPQSFPAIGGGEFSWRVDWQYIGPTWFHTVQDDEAVSNFGGADYSKTERDSYNTVDMRLGIQMDHWSVHAFGRNLFNEEYLEEVIPAPEFGGSFIHPAARRTYGIELGYRF
ncbi:MAG: TonB-dependent receptor [Deltaproteobacteria bacterium]|nr:TonB-dependent receptor [Deltaproteobacteria bacterium]